MPGRSCLRLVDLSTRMRSHSSRSSRGVREPCHRRGSPDRRVPEQSRVKKPVPSWITLDCRGQVGHSLDSPEVDEMLSPCCEGNRGECCLRLMVSLRAESPAVHPKGLQWTFAAACGDHIQITPVSRPRLPGRSCWVRAPNLRRVWPGTRDTRHERRCNSQRYLLHRCCRRPRFPGRSQCRRSGRRLSYRRHWSTQRHD